MTNDPNLKYIFFGTPKFAGLVLAKLIEAKYIPQAVICNPDRPVGRKKIITSPPVKLLAQTRGIKVFQPETLSVSDLPLMANDIDLFIVAAYAKIVPQEILNIPRRGVIGIHPSLLPKYRGASPIQSALLAGEEKTGVSLYVMDEKMDHGPILAQVECPITQSEDYLSLEKKLGTLGGELLAETLPSFINSKIKPQEQDHASATFTKKFKTENGFVDEKDLHEAIAGDKTRSVFIDRKIRALSQEPGVWTIIKNKRVKLLEAVVKDSKLTLLKIQEDGKKPSTPDPLKY